MPCHPCKNPIETNDNEIIYSIEPIIIKSLLPILSIKYRPKRVKIKLVTPTPILLNKSALFCKPAASKIRGA